jgi:PAS domain S-box-containing protein/diguanylate cyclase (GGDEF)-like protein
METLPETYLEDSPYVFFKWSNQPGWPVEYILGNVLKIFGFTKEEFLSGKIRYEQIIYPDDLSRVIDEVIRAGNSSENEFFHQPYRIVTADNKIRWIDDKTKIERDTNGAIINYYGYISDITDLENSKEELKSSLHRLNKISKEAEEYRRALDESYIVSTADKDGTITYVNDNFVAVSGYTREELIGQSHNIFRHPSVPKQTFEEMWKTIQSKQNWHGMIRNRAKDGKSYFVKMTIVPILDESGEIEQYIAVRYDMTTYIHQQEQIKVMAFRSHITGLPNLYALVRDIEREEHPFLAMVNIDGFKVLNNLYGYKTGDFIIKAISGLLQQKFTSEACVIYHIHADEFAILCTDEPYPVFIQQLHMFQEFIHKDSFTIESKKIPIHISIATSDDIKEHLLVSCNMAMHYARSEHKRFVSYGEEIDFSENYQNNLLWTTILHDAIENDLISPFFQPIYDTRNDTIYKFEALIRIKKENEVFTPYLFLEIAKKVKLYSEISLIMLEKCFDAIRIHPYDFSINLSLEDIMNKHYVERLFQLLALPREGGVILEIVESEGIENFETINAFIEKAKGFGCSIAIDDFGSGYSNFVYLLKLNADYIKIDGSLIRDIDTNIDAQDVVQTIITFAEKKNIPIIAEYVANKAVFAKIKSMGIQYAQGYYVGKPTSEIVIPKPTFTQTPPEQENDELIRLLYVSRADETLSYQQILEILNRSWHNNHDTNITGFLIYDGTFFIQCLEGDPLSIESCYVKITKDTRHHTLKMISKEPIGERNFKDWNMSYIGHNIYSQIIPKYAENSPFDPYSIESKNLLQLLNEIHKIA